MRRFAFGLLLGALFAAGYALAGITTYPGGGSITGTVAVSSSTLPTGASTEATLALIKAKTDNLDVALSTRTKPADTQAVSAVALPLPSGAATSAKQPAFGTAGTAGADVVTVQGIASMTALKVDGSGFTQPMSAVSLPLPTGAATETTLGSIKTGTDKIPSSPSTDRATAAAPFSVRLSDGAAFYDSAKTGQLPSALVGSRLDVNAGAWLGSTAPTIGQKAMASSIPVVLSSDQSTVTVSGTVTANQGGAPWSVSGSGTFTVAGAKTNNAAAPGATNAGVLPALATAAVQTWTEGNQVAMSVDLSGRARTDVSSWFGSTAPTVGSKASANSIPVVIASDQAAVAVSGTVTANQGGAPWSVSGSGTFTVAGAKTNNNAAPGATNLGAMMSVANAAAPSWTEGNLVLASVDLSGRQRVDNSSWIGSTAPTVGSKTSANSLPVVIASDQGAVTVAGSGTFTVAGGKTNNNAAPGATNVGVLPAIATAAVQTWTEGNLVNMSVDLSGRARIDNTSWLGSTAPTVGSKTSANSIPVVVASDQGNVPTNVAQVGGANTVNGGLAGSLSVGGTAANNAAINQNPLLVGVEALSSQPTAATTGNQRRLVGSLDGALYVRPGGPVPWTCSVDAIGATLTQCQAAPASGLKLYVTDIMVTSTTSTAGQYLIRYGTGTNCGTGTTSLFPSAATAVRIPYAANTAAPTVMSFQTPLAPAAANAVCIICVATNTCTAQLSGYTAP